jgi:hypothetical protein
MNVGAKFIEIIFPECGWRKWGKRVKDMPRIAHIWADIWITDEAGMLSTGQQRWMPQFQLLTNVRPVEIQKGKFHSSICNQHFHTHFYTLKLIMGTSKLNMILWRCKHIGTLLHRKMVLLSRGRIFLKRSWLKHRYPSLLQYTILWRIRQFAR